RRGGWCCGAEGGANLGAAEGGGGYKEWGEARGGPGGVPPDPHPVLLPARELLGLALLHGRFLDRGVASRQDEPMEGRDHRETVARRVRHAPLRVERVTRDGLRADAKRVGPLLGLEAERRGARRRGRGGGRRD